MANEYRRHKEAEEKMQTEFEDKHVYTRQILFEKRDYRIAQKYFLTEQINKIVEQIICRF